MVITAQNANSIARSLGKTLVESGYKMIKSSFNITPQQVDSNTFIDFLLKKLPKCTLGLMDSNYFLTDIETWKNIIAEDWLQGTKKWIADKFDCDNFAYCFASHCSELYDISVSTCYGEVFHKDTNASLGFHYWNTITTKEADGKMHLYFYEPENDNYEEIPDGTTTIVMGNMKYYALRIICF